jgi:hypothetical protein
MPAEAWSSLIPHPLACPEKVWGKEIGFKVYMFFLS